MERNNSERFDSFDVLLNRHRYCWLTGWSESFRPAGWYSDWWMQVAHIASGQGRATRVDDRRAVVILCPLAHDLHVSNSDSFRSKVINGVRYETIDERHTLWLKKRFDPDFYDLDFLRSIWIGRLPEPEPPPSSWAEVFFNSTGILW